MAKEWQKQKDPKKSRGYKWSKSTTKTRYERRILYGPSHHIKPFINWKGYDFNEGAVKFKRGDIRERMMMMIAEVLADMAKRKYRRKHEIAKWRKAYQIWKDTTW